MTPAASHESVIRTWIVVCLLALFIVAKGLFAFSVIGDRGQPAWDYRPVADVPSQSPYAIYEKLPYPQHIRGSRGE